MEQTLDEKGDQLKEQLVGVEVFDRKGDYDPRTDPIVRVEAMRLRSKLKAYYTSAGRPDCVLIELPKGAYVPVVPEAECDATGQSRASEAAIVPERGGGAIHRGPSIYQSDTRSRAPIISATASPKN